MSEATQEETKKPSDEDKRAGKTRVKLTEKQLEAVADELARKVKERNELDESTHVKTWNEGLRQLDDEITELAEERDTGWAWRAVQRDWVKESEAKAKPNGAHKANGKKPKAKMAHRIDRLAVLRLAADAGTDPRSAAKALRGEPVKGLAGERLAREIAKRSETAELTHATRNKRELP